MHHQNFRRVASKRLQRHTCLLSLTPLPTTRLCKEPLWATYSPHSSASGTSRPMRRPRLTCATCWTMPWIQSFLAAVIARTAAAKPHWVSAPHRVAPALAQCSRATWLLLPLKQRCVTRTTTTTTSAPFAACGRKWTARRLGAWTEPWWRVSLQHRRALRLWAWTTTSWTWIAPKPPAWYLRWVQGSTPRQAWLACSLPGTGQLRR
mmetsp:Transcript_4213/g.12100  ORF Transcript_4213/g.12100 Transcript_4213/m.12100 type:complete len:206 (-) Transcript_4213:1725-2342(-)